MTKERLVQVRISVEEADFIEKMGAKKSEIWRIGYEKWASQFPDFLQEKKKEYEELYTQCNDKLKICNDIVITKNTTFKRLKAEYESQNRSITNPSYQDLSWIKARCERKKINYDEFMRYLQRGK